MNQHDIFDSLARNAFDFLERGIGEFDKAPKYSVIHFCAAVEMLLKARLMKEHWSLIVSKPEQANLAKFMAGDFASVTMDEARARIESPIYVVDDYFIHWETVREYNEACYELSQYRQAVKHLYAALTTVSDEEWPIAKMVEEVEQSKNDHYPIRLG